MTDEAWVFLFDVEFSIVDGLRSLLLSLLLKPFVDIFFSDPEELLSWVPERKNLRHVEESVID